MIPLHFPKVDFRLKKEQGQDLIFDPFRKQWVRLTPEEWVRQNFLQYLTVEKHYPGALIAVEKEILVGEMVKRFDILIYDRNHAPWMLVECKAMDIPLTEGVWQQVLRYGIAVPATYVVIVNGKECRGWKKVQGGLEELNDLPLYGN